MAYTTKQKVEEFQQHIIILGDKEQPQEKRNMAEREALKLFYKGAMMEVSYIDNEGKIVHANAAAADMLGYQVDEMERLTLSGILHARSKEFHPGLSVKESKEVIFKTRTGTSILAYVVSGTIASQARATGFYMVVCPIAQEQEEANRRYQALFEETNDGIFILTLEGIMVDTNKQGLEMLGYEREDLIGRSYVDTIAQSEVVDSSERIDILKRGESMPVYERVFKRRDGTLFPAEINVALISDDSGEPLYLQSIVRYQCTKSC